MVTPQTTWKHSDRLLETRRTSQYHLPSSPEGQPWKSSHCDDRDNLSACGTGRRESKLPGIHQSAWSHLQEDHWCPGPGYGSKHTLPGRRSCILSICMHLISFRAVKAIYSRSSIWTAQQLFNSVFSDRALGFRSHKELIYKLKKNQPGMAIHTIDQYSLAKAGYSLRVPGQPGLHSKVVFNNK